MAERILDSDLLFERMELTTRAGRAIADRASERGGGLTQLELRELTLMRLDQERRLMDWADALRSEGKTVRLHKGLISGPRPGLTVNAQGRGRPVLWLYGDIGAQFGGVTADDFRRALDEIHDDEELELHIHSDGGDYHDGVAMHSLIQARTGRTIGVVDSVAASAATFPLMACDRVLMKTGSWLMIHECSASLREGKAEDFEGAASRMRATNEDILEIYVQRWKRSVPELQTALSAETWFSDVQSVEAGLADAVVSDVAIAARISRRNTYKNLPPMLSIAARREDCPLLLAMELAEHRLADVE